MTRIQHIAAWGIAIITTAATAHGQSWSQYQGDSLRSGNGSSQRMDVVKLRLAGAVPLSDAIFTSPAVVDGRVYVVDGTGTAWCIDAATMRVVWKTPTEQTRFNCNNVSSPAVVNGRVHFGTTGGAYYVLNAADGAVVKRIACGEPIFASPVVTDQGVTFATAGSDVYGLTPDGEIRWTWSYVRDVLKFTGDKWNGEDWAKQLNDHVSWRHQFVCSREIAAKGDMIVIPAGGVVVWLRDEGDKATAAGAYVVKESPATYGLSMDQTGAVYRQWYRRDNTGRVEVLRLEGGNVTTSFVKGTDTNYGSDFSMGVSAVAIRGDDVYRTRPEAGYGLVRHKADGGMDRLGAYPSITPPVLTAGHALVSGLDGALYVVPLQDGGEPKVFATPFGRPITAPAAVADGRVAFGGEDGYLYVLAPDGKADWPTKPLDLHHVRHRIENDFAAADHDWFTNFGNLSNTNRTTEQGLAAPFKLRWLRRVEGTIKQASVNGGGRLYTHTAEGQLFAVEQDTGRLLWRVYYPGVHVSYTSPIYYNEKLLVPQAGLEQSRLRCFDAATGKLLWEAPFTGSPSWNRQLPPIIHDGMVFYQFSNGKYDGKGWLFEHQRTFGFPDDHKPLVKAWDLETGREKWSLDFSEHGAGGDDAGLCVMDGVLYYSCYFGKKDTPGITAAIDPKTGNVLWKTTQYAVHGGCTISAKDGRLYLGGYNAVDGDKNYIWCLDAKDGSLLWQSDPIGWVTHVVTLADDFAFSHHQYRISTLTRLADGKQLANLTQGYNCTRFTMAGRYLLGSNMDIYDTADGHRLLSTGPAIDVITCTGSQVSNGRIFFTANGGGLQASMHYGEEAKRVGSPWVTE